MLVLFALGNAKVLSFALSDAKVPNANHFASQWNKGLKHMSHQTILHRPKKMADFARLKKSADIVTDFFSMCR